MKLFKNAALGAVLTISPVWLGAQAPVAPVAPQTPIAPQPPSAPAPPQGPARMMGSYLGVGLQELTTERAKALNLHEDAGIEITRVGKDSPAEKAGLKAGDVVLEYNGERVEGMEQFSRLVHETPSGREVKLKIFRNGGTQTLSAVIGQRSGHVFMGPDGAPFVVPTPDIPRIFQGLQSPMLGIEAEPVQDQLAQYFGVKEGVLVRSVLKDSPAEKAGLKAGDVITRLDDGKVASPTDISGRLRRMAGKTVALGLTRDHKDMTVMVTLDQNDRTGGLGFPRGPVHVIDFSSPVRLPQ